MTARIPADLIASAARHGLTIQRGAIAGLDALTPGGRYLHGTRDAADMRRFLMACDLNADSTREIAARIDSEAQIVAKQDVPDQWPHLSAQPVQARAAAFVAVRKTELAAVPPTNSATPDQAIAAIEAGLVAAGAIEAPTSRD